ncbi:hypothetical protein BC835DRAFT_748736 [Cytidiella melzeri]|nr:hypothetical protein BC835DRAFT_748736 [Cytidiella melzeri]
MESCYTISSFLIKRGKLQLSPLQRSHIIFCNRSTFTGTSFNHRPLCIVQQHTGCQHSHVLTSQWPHNRPPLAESLSGLCSLLVSAVRRALLGTWESGKGRHRRREPSDCEARVSKTLTFSQGTHVRGSPLAPHVSFVQRVQPVVAALRKSYTVQRVMAVLVFDRRSNTTGQSRWLSQA